MGFFEPMFSPTSRGVCGRNKDVRRSIEAQESGHSRAVLMLLKNKSCEHLQFPGVEAGEGWHGHGAPPALAAGADMRFNGHKRFRVSSILRRDIPERRADDLLLKSVAAETPIGIDEGLDVRLGKRRRTDPGFLGYGHCVTIGRR